MTILLVIISLLWVAIEGFLNYQSVIKYQRLISPKFQLITNSAHYALETESDSQYGNKLKDLLSTKLESERNSITIIAGFEKFNSQLYRTAATEVMRMFPTIPIYVFTDNDILERPNDVETALSKSKVLLSSLIFDYSTIQWIKDNRINDIPYRFCFESALELMSETRVDDFNMMPSSSGTSSGPPPAIRAILKQFGSQREEDKMTGYLKLLKIGPKLLKLLGPAVDNVGGIKTWVTVYSYWTESGLENIKSMLNIIIKDCKLITKPVKSQSGAFIPTKSSRIDSNDIVDTIDSTSSSIPRINEVKEFPALGIYHPGLDEINLTITDPAEYVKWYTTKNTWVNELTPRVGLLLYRKHVISQQSYIANIIKLMESNNIMPIPVYINGVEGHTVVRDLFTSSDEVMTGNYQKGAVIVDAVVNTIGFPLVGGPAGSMEGKHELLSRIFCQHCKLLNAFRWT